MVKVCGKCGDENRFPSGGCKTCASARYEKNRHTKIAKVAEWRRNNPDKVRLYSAKWRESHPDDARNAIAAWREKNADRIKQVNRQWGINNSERKAATALAWRISNPERTAFLVSEWAKSNGARRSEITAKRRSARLLRTVAWADHDAIKSIYEKAASLGLHVDHIIPLQGGIVSGLHVEYNLQLLTPQDNKRKQNKFDPTTYVHEVPA